MKTKLKLKKDTVTRWICGRNVSPSPEQSWYTQQFHIKFLPVSWCSKIQNDIEATPPPMKVAGPSLNEAKMTETFTIRIIAETTQETDLSSI